MKEITERQSDGLQSSTDTYKINKTLKLNIVNEGESTDKVLVQGENNEVKFIPRSEFDGGKAATLQEVVTESAIVSGANYAKAELIDPTLSRSSGLLLSAFSSTNEALLSSTTEIYDSKNGAVNGEVYISKRNKSTGAETRLEFANPIAKGTAVWSLPAKEEGTYILSTTSDLEQKANITSLISGRIPFVSSANTLSDSTRLLWDNGSSKLEINGNRPSISVREPLNNYGWDITNSSLGSGNLLVKSKNGARMLLIENPDGPTSASQPKMSIGNFEGRIPQEAQLYVYGGANGANIDARGSVVVDEANMDLEGSDWEINPSSIGFSYYGVNYSKGGTILGYNKVNKGIIRWGGDAQPIIVSLNDKPIRFGVNDIEIFNTNSLGLEYKSDFSSSNASNPRWIVDKEYVDNKLQPITRYKTYVALLTQTGTNPPVATVLENTLGDTIVWSRSSAGVYHGTLAGTFIVGKTTMSASVTTSDSSVASGTTLNIAAISTQKLDTLVATDGQLVNSMVEIRVYP
ncbi:hypothetical protein LNQ49_06300 [Flavobacterium sp. F-65]|uniref:Uncharacterized protein n=1 Tax=Flavobacterium pisciphilum TaxID=2893755 RepID=A0ABS8MRC3_9FLAO|nr:hypothetical protein [Flavobacterium sp. F-65]MCC9071203.1 hypothetical protein [Flavobacterium sp. F-65]